uniref:BRCT domain-containing protein n=1 Tax=Romanomermis culicivorax TaxID=13658 RepID=A0A915IVL1_ROMCU
MREISSANDFIASSIEDDEDQIKSEDANILRRQLAGALTVMVGPFPDKASWKIFTQLVNRFGAETTEGGAAIRKIARAKIKVVSSTKESLLPGIRYFEKCYKF